MKTDLASFEGFASNSRTWVYQSSRDLTDAEAEEVKNLASGFASEWKSHGTPLNAAAEVLYNRFLVMMVDEDAGTASGCSIDSSVAQIRSIEQKLNIDLFDRMNLAYLNSKGEMEAVHANSISRAVEHNVLDANSTVFNNMISSFAELQNSWRIPLNESWAWSRCSNQINA
jgi:hypothetical protein